MANASGDSPEASAYGSSWSRERLRVFYPSLTCRVTILITCRVVILIFFCGVLRSTSTIRGRRI